MKGKIFILSIAIFFTTSCSTSLNRARILSNGDINYQKNTRKDRVLSIKNGDTLYSDSLRCISKHGKLGKKPDIAVARTIDKTGKVFPAIGQKESTALSEMVSHALSKTGMFEILDIPLSSDTMLTSRSSVATFPHIKDLINKNPGLYGALSAFPAGVLFRSDNYISGALVQYDESSDVPYDNYLTSLNIEPLEVSQQNTVIKIGIILRMINSSSSRLTTINAKPMSVMMTNRLLAIRKDINLFKIISLKNREFNYVVNASDPKHYAVYEMIEKAIFDLISTPTKLKETCGLKNTVFKKAGV